MALSQSDLTKLLESLHAADSVEMIRHMLQRMLPELIEAEATNTIHAAPYQRTPERTTHRNGHRERLLTSTAGDVEVHIPKLRSGSFFPSLLERRRRIDRALFAVIMEAYVHGVSTRSVDDLVKALGADSGISRSEVSRICSGLSDPVTAITTALPLDLAFATKGELAIDLLRDAYADGVHLDFVAADEVYGTCTKPRAFLEEHGQAYVLRVRATFALTLGGGTRLTCEQAVARHLKQKRTWTISSAGNGSKGERTYARAWIATAGPARSIMACRSCGLVANVMPWGTLAAAQRAASAIHDSRGR
ncbi:transposase [Spongiactinospora sp. 9N601]|uniref:transposase n=1 Tax=Spongiactinospora sp. 9N601 TaxID=3375149 RepID=UPI00378C26CE